MGTTAQKLQNIINSKADIGAAITEKGGTVPAKLIDYGKAIRALPAWGTSARQIQAGRDWIQATVPPDKTELQSRDGMVYGDGVFLLLDTNGGIYRSEDGGDTWSGPLYIEGNPSVTYHVGGAYGGGVFVIGDVNTATLYRSTDRGKTWTQIDGDGMTSHERICFGGGVFVAVDSYGGVSRSTDLGLTWEFVDDLNKVSISHGWVAYGCGVFVATGVDGQNKFRFYRSEDGGKTWEDIQPYSDNQSGSAFSPIAYGGGVFIAADEDSAAKNITLHRSTDLGKTWTQIEVPTDVPQNVYTILYGQGLFVVIPYAFGDVKPPILVSADGGSTWSLVDMEQSIKCNGAAAYGEGVFVFCDNTGITLRSFNGLTEEPAATAEEGS